VSNGPNSDWIARNANITDQGPAPYTFTRAFDLTGFDLSTASLAGAWTLDDGGTLSSNGHQLAALSPLNWTSLHPFSVAAGSPFFNQGLNTLTITITTSDQFREGVHLEGAVTASPAPEPSTLALAGVGVAGVMGYVWRRRRKPAVG
jgi:hypothetical protein